MICTFCKNEIVVKETAGYFGVNEAIKKYHPDLEVGLYPMCGRNCSELYRREKYERYKMLHNNHDV